TYLLTPAIANEHSDEDVIRPVLLVRYVTMLGEEGLWPVKLDPSDQKPNNWNVSAKNIVKAAIGAWVRIISKQKNGQYRHQVSPKSIEQEKPKFSNRSIDDLIDAAYDKDHRVYDNNHEVWTILAEGKAIARSFAHASYFPTASSMPKKAGEKSPAFLFVFV